MEGPIGSIFNTKSSKDLNCIDLFHFVRKPESNSGKSQLELFTDPEYIYLVGYKILQSVMNEMTNKLYAKFSCGG